MLEEVISNDLLLVIMSESKALFGLQAVDIIFP